MRSLFYKFIHIYFLLINYPSLWHHEVKFGENLKLRGMLYIKTVARKGTSIYIGNNARINSSIESDPIGGDNKTILYTRGSGTINVADNVGISNCCIVSMSFVNVGEGTMIGGGTKIYDTDFHSLRAHDRISGDKNIKTKGINIGKNVFVGGHCIILKGVTIGDNSVIGAGSVVTKDIPSDCVAAGNPCQIIRKF